MQPVQVRCPHCRVELRFRPSGEDTSLRGDETVRLWCAACGGVFRAVAPAPVQESPVPDLGIGDRRRSQTSRYRLIRAPEASEFGDGRGFRKRDRRGPKGKARPRKGWFLLATAALTAIAILYVGLQMAAPEGRLLGQPLPLWLTELLDLPPGDPRGDVDAAGEIVYRPRVPRVEGRPCLALVGFENRSGDTDADWLAHALGGMFRSNLDALPLRVIEGDEIDRMRRDLAVTDLAQPELVPIAHRLGCNLIALGTYRLPQPLAVQFRLAVLDPQDQTLLADTEFDAVAVSDLPAAVGEGSWELYSELEQRGVASTETPIEPPEVWPAEALWPRTVGGLRPFSQGLGGISVLDLRSAEIFLRQATRAESPRVAPLLEWSRVLAELGYRDRALDTARRAWEASQRLPSELRLAAEAHYRHLEAAKSGSADPSPPAVQLYEELWRLDPDAAEPGLALVRLHVEAARAGSAAAVLTRLRTLPEPVRADPRIELITAEVAALRSATGDRLRAARRAARRSEELGALTWWGQARLAESRALLDEHDAAAAIEAAETALELLRRVNDDAAAAQAHHALAVAGYALQDFDRAESHYESALMTLRRLGDRDAQADIYLHRGRLQARLGRPVEAAEDFRSAGELFREAQDREGEAGAYVEQAGLYRQAGELSQAEGALRKAMELYRQLENETAELETWLAVGDAIAARERLQQAGDVYQSIRERTEADPPDRVHARSLERLAELARLRAEASQASTLLRQASSLYRQLGDRAGQARSQLLAARLEADQGRWRQAETALVALRQELQEEAFAGERLQARVEALLAHTQLYQGKLEDARATLEAARAHLPPRPLVSTSSAGGTAAGGTAAGGTSAEGASAEGAGAAAPPSLPVGDGLGIGPELELALAAARLDALEGRAPFALAALEKLQAELLDRRRIGDELEVRLAQGEIESMSGTRAAGRARLTGLRQDAQSRGYRGMAQRAARALERPLSPK